jgi:hypothetical protein
VSPRSRATHRARAYAQTAAPRRNSKFDAPGGGGNDDNDDHPMVNRAAEIARHRHEAQARRRADAARARNPPETPGAAAGVWVGDVRGSGLFLGVELVTDRGSRTPATAATSLLCSRLKDEHRILTSIDGPHDNVLVVKPPMCFEAADADALVDAMADVLTRMTREDVAAVGSERTPT